MKKLLTYIVLTVLITFSSCRNNTTSQYFPLQKSRGQKYFEPTPFGMAYVNRGVYNIGADDDELFDHSLNKKISEEAFWIDDTEITNNEYRQFVYWVRDKKARELLGQVFPEFIISKDDHGEPLERSKINWNVPIRWNDPEYQQAMEDFYLPEKDRFNFKKEIDTRKLVYEYDWVDYKQASKRSNCFNYKTKRYEGSVINAKGKVVPIKNRSSFLMRESVPVYPDTLCWIRDFAYTYNDPYTLKYFSHPAFDDYPVVGVNWKQARAFCKWRSKLKKVEIKRFKEAAMHDFRLPTEIEWEIAARGGLQHSKYPWGGYYTRDIKGCFVANFKPLRGNYVADSEISATTTKVGTFDPNPYGIYDMAGNVAEWTSTAYYEAAYEVINAINPEIEYNARADDPPVMKRKVVRGGAWKDVAYFIQTSTRTFEYQDTTRSYIGFRCVCSSSRNYLENR